MGNHPKAEAVSSAGTSAVVATGAATTIAPAAAEPVPLLTASAQIPVFKKLTKNPLGQPS